MKKVILASACILALASPAGAQTTKPLDGASSQGNVGPGASQGAMKEGTGTMNQGTTGASSRPSPGGDASTSGANTAVGVNNTGTAKQPGGREGWRQQTVRDTSNTRGRSLGRPHSFDEQVRGAALLRFHP